MEKPFTISKVSWITQTYGLQDKRELVIEDHFNFAKFLQDNDLTNRTLVSRIEEIDDDFEICSNDLTVEGLAFTRKIYDKWISKIDNGMSPKNISLLEKALKKIRE